MTEVAEVYRNLTRGEAYARVGVEIAKANNGSVDEAEAVLSQIQRELASLKDAGVKAPTGLKTVATEALAALREQYELHAASAEDRLGQPEAVRSVMRVDVAAEQRRLNVAQTWIAAIDAVESA